MNTQQTLQTLLLTTVLMLSLGQTARAGSVSLPNTFVPDTPARAAEVNANFNAVKTAVDDNDSRVVALEGTITTLQTTITNQQATIDDQQSAIATLQDNINDLLTRLQALENNSVLALDGKLELVDPDAHGYATARFTGVNVQVVNGVSQNAANGLGNLIIGYNANRDVAGGEVCSDGQYDNLTDCESNGGTWAANHKSGSHNLVGGNQNSYSATGGLVFGTQNVINRNYATVTGGHINIASGDSSNVSGGVYNLASGYSSSISGGFGNTASGNHSSISGGYNNIASGDLSSVSGGHLNIASGDSSSVSGGDNNTASGISSSISGGSKNTASGFYSSISGGESNTATTDGSSVSGGYNNTASGVTSSVSGGSGRSAPDSYDWAAGSLFQTQ